MYTAVNFYKIQILIPGIEVFLHNMVFFNVLKRNQHICFMCFFTTVATFHSRNEIPNDYPCVETDDIVVYLRFDKLV